MIGEHTVTLVPDPDVEAWGPQLAPNALFATDLAGWGVRPFSPTVWTWDAGDALATNSPPLDPNRQWQLIRRADAPIPRDASGSYRVRVEFKVSAATPVVVGLTFGMTPEAANGGTFWNPGEALDRHQWLNIPTAGTHAFEIVVPTLDIASEFAYLAPHCIVWPGTRPFPSPPRIGSIELHGQGAVAEDLSCLIDEVTIRHGREDTDSQPDAASATLAFSVDTTVGAFPSSLEIGGIIRVTTDLVDASSIRFVGRITDLETSWDDAGEQTPNRLVAQVIAVGMLSDLGRRIVGDAPFPQELDGARVSRVMALAGVTLNPAFSDPGTVQILPRDIDSRAALEVSRGTAESASGVVWHTRSGEVRYADADHRRGATPILELDSCDILVAPKWRRSTEGLLNLVSIGYGPTPEEGEQPRYVASAPTSVDAYGRYELSTATELAEEADAAEMGNLLLARNSSPVWVLSDLPIDVKNLSAAQTTALLTLDVHSLIRLTGLPIAGSAPTSIAAWVEGWTETLAWGAHDLTLTVSGYCRTAPAPRWDDIDPETTWDNSGSLTWDETNCLGPLVNAGRWADVPASLRWNDATAPTWDTWDETFGG